MEKAPPKARLFVAMDLPNDAREALVDWRARAFAGRDDVRLLDPQALHVTLVFLGHMPEDDIERIGAVISDAVPEGVKPVLTAAGVKPIPSRRPRLFALDLQDEDGRASAIQHAIAGALEGAGLYEAEQRQFWPHVTLARVRKGTHARPLAGQPPPALAPWAADAITLYRSRLSPRGARYESLKRVPLKRLFN